MKTGRGLLVPAAVVDAFIMPPVSMRRQPAPIGASVI
jgi:hypothetical protein